METPWVQLRSVTFHPFVYRRMVAAASPGLASGECVNVYDKRRELFGHGLYNARSQIALRMLNHDAAPIDTTFWHDTIQRAVSLRTRTLRLDESTNAYRLIHAEGDDLTGLIVDRFGDVLSVEVFSLGIWQRIRELLPILHECVGTAQHLAEPDSRAAEQEGFHAAPIASDGLARTINITENNVRFRIAFEAGHKTGFFCDQRDNRQRFAKLAQGDVLDLCCYTGGFGVYARALGRAQSVTCVDLDENAVELARQNANLNQVRIDTVQADAFTYMRQMHANSRQFDAIVLDPPKLIFGRTEQEEGRKKYLDLNRLAAGLVRPGGLLVTCSCSGALPRDAFVQMATSAARHAQRQAQILDVTGAGPDHPISPRCPESEYLKVVWLRLN